MTVHAIIDLQTGPYSSVEELDAERVRIAALPESVERDYMMSVIDSLIAHKKKEPRTTNPAAAV